MKSKNRLVLIIAIVASFSLVAFACGDDDDDNGGGGGGNTLQQVRDRGTLRCGVKDGQPGFGNIEPDGSYAGNDIEYCKAIAAAVFGDATKVEYVLASAQDRFELLSSGQIDVLVRTTTWTSSRDIGLQTRFTTTTFYDGQGIIVSADSNYSDIQSLNGSTICVTGGTTTEQNLNDVLGGAGVRFTPLTFEDDPSIQAAFIAGRCDAWTGDKGNLAGQRSGFPAAEGGPEALRILPVTISKEPLGPVVREGDDDWFDIVQWTVFGLINAEELGVTSANVAAAAANPPSAAIARLLGVGYEGGEVFNFGASLGLDPGFMQKVIAAVGNYGEIYERTIEPIGLPRAGTLNDLWTRGGLIYGAPIR